MNSWIKFPGDFFIFLFSKILILVQKSSFKMNSSLIEFYFTFSYVVKTNSHIKTVKILLRIFIKFTDTTVKYR